MTPAEPAPEPAPCVHGLAVPACLICRDLEADDAAGEAATYPRPRRRADGPRARRLAGDPRAPRRAAAGPGVARGSASRRSARRRPAGARAVDRPGSSVVVRLGVVAIAAVAATAVLSVLALALALAPAAVAVVAVAGPLGWWGGRRYRGVRGR